MELDLKQLKSSGLCLEDFIFLQMIHEGIEPKEYVFYQSHVILTTDLEAEGYLKILDFDDLKHIELRQKAVELFGKNTTNIADWIEQWCELWPKGVKSGGYYVKPNKQDALSNMQKFFKKYKFTKEQVFEATGNYLKQQEAKHWDYTMLGAYFIMKNGMSQLANYCNNLGVKEKTNASINKMI